MENLYNANTYTSMVTRINSLTENSPALWGKMKVAQMLAHSTQAFKVPLSEHIMPRLFIGRLIGWAIKPKLYNEDPWKRNLPTSPISLLETNVILRKKNKAS